MPPLGDFLGHLMTEIARARMLGDAETARLATLYAADPLLRHLTVPRFRLPELSIDVPVVINGLAGSTAAVPRPDRPTLHNLFEAIVFEALEPRAGRVTKAVLRTLRHQIAEAIRRSDDFPEIPDALAWTAAMTARVLPPLRLLAPNADFAEIENAVREACRVKFGGTPAPASADARLEIAFAAEELRQAGPANVAHFRLSVKENGVEWMSLEASDGTVEQRLVPE